ncbi:MAG: hypothetical protein NZ483_02710 [Verrucomicrobiae bacterium]|nr:hypothetical protein [Verrucomicrobiae bacterium]
MHRWLVCFGLWLVVGEAYAGGAKPRDASAEPVRLPAHTEAVPDRWRIPIGVWQRYDHPASRGTETPYQTGPRTWHPYLQSLLKGDFPIWGQDVFLNLTVFNITEFEGRTLPKPSGVSTEDPFRTEFYGSEREWFVSSNFGLRMDLFRGETAFKPVEWLLRLEPVLNVNHTDVQERNILFPDPRQRPERTKRFFALQEAFLELHLADLSPNYDFLAVKGGNQAFNSDFRGFIFNDTNLGGRFLGNADNNHWQYNLAVFHMREKDTFSGLNDFRSRDQQVVVANIYRQDFLTKGYTASLNFHANFDGDDVHYDRVGNIVRPAPIGDVRPHEVRAFYLGWLGEGHIEWLNISHAFYQAFGTDEHNGLAGQRVDINAQMAALELSVDRDWLRPKLSFFYASGDDDAEDDEATGFDSILDNPNFIGGPFSFWVRQGFNLGGTLVALKQPGSLLPNLRSSKTQGQANFVNPGIFIIGLGLEAELTPKLRAVVHANYLRFADANPVRVALHDDNVRTEIGWELNLGFTYRPLLTDNIIILAGVGALIPGGGFRDIYKTAPTPVPGVGGGGGDVEPAYFSGLLSVRLVY